MKYITQRDLLLLSLSKYGMAEVDGKESNPELLTMIHKYHNWVQDDSEFAWCALYMRFMLDELGVNTDGITSAARSFIAFGNTKYIDDISVGDIVVFWRKSPDGPYGHVAQFINYTDSTRKYMRVLGGNQSNSVSIKTYNSDRILAVRDFCYPGHK